MSVSLIHKTIFAVVVAALLTFTSGCGGDEPAPTPVTPDTAATAPTSEATSEQGATTPAPEGKDLAPVDLQLDDGGFARSTPKTFHVPSGFLVLITAKNVSDTKIRLSISAPSMAQTFKIAPGKTETITLASIGEGESAKLISGGQTIKVAADAEPGP